MSSSTGPIIASSSFTTCPASSPDTHSVSFSASFSNCSSTSSVALSTLSFNIPNNHSILMPPPALQSIPETVISSSSINPFTRHYVIPYESDRIYEGPRYDGRGCCSADCCDCGKCCEYCGIAMGGTFIAGVAGFLVYACCGILKGKYS